MVSTGTAKGLIFGTFAFGVLLIAVGTVVIEGAKSGGWFIPWDTPGPWVYHGEWDEFRLETGIIISLVGAALATASATCLLLTRERKASMRIVKGMIFGALAIGVILVAVGTVVIEGARNDADSFIFWDTSEPKLYHYEWDEFRLDTGIIISLAGMALTTASVTYLTLTREGKGTSEKPLC